MFGQTRIGLRESNKTRETKEYNRSESTAFAGEWVSIGSLRVRAGSCSSAQ